MKTFTISALPGASSFPPASCVFCNGSHRIYDCSSFRSLSVEDRIAGAARLKLCLNCLRADFHDLVFKNAEVDDVIEAEHSYPVTLDIDDVYDSDPILHLPDIEPETDDNWFELFENQPVVYVSGYLASALVKRCHCSKCCDSLRTLKPGSVNTYNYKALKEWWKDKLSLTYPTLNLCNTVFMCNHI
ncbi:unnamed protein product [Colias eurytheme]|nr:unnamed protein product [Colias eurytheme]